MLFNSHRLLISQKQMDANGCNWVSQCRRIKRQWASPIVTLASCNIDTSSQQLVGNCVEQMEITISLLQNVFEKKKTAIHRCLTAAPRIWIDYLIKSFGDFDTLYNTNFTQIDRFYVNATGKKGHKSQN